MLHGCAGVVVGWDKECERDAGWAAAVSVNPHQPFYHVLPDEGAAASSVSHVDGVWAVQCHLPCKLLPTPCSNRFKCMVQKHRSVPCAHGLQMENCMQP